MAPVDLRIEVPTLVCSLTRIANLHGLVSGISQRVSFENKKTKRELFINTRVDITNVLMTISTCSLEKLMLFERFEK